MKKALWILLAAIMVFSLAACVGGNSDASGTTGTPTEPTEPTKPLAAVEPQKKDGVYQLSEPGHLLFLAENPDKDYVLCGDIDMGGYAWTPVDTFSGSLTGKISDLYNYTISDLTIEAAGADANVGFFRVVTGTIKQVNFENVTITADGTFSGNLGVVAGQNDSKLEGVDVKNSTVTVTAKDANIGMVTGNNVKGLSDSFSTGTLKVTLAGGTTYVGGATGACGNILLDVESRVVLDVSGSGTAGAAGGIAGCLSSAARNINYGGQLKVNADATFAAGTLAGNLTKGGIATGFNCATQVQVTGAAQQDAYVGKAAANAAMSDCWTRDLSKSDIPAAELALRQQVVDYMYRTCTYRWIPAKDMYYIDTCNTSSKHEQSWKAGQVYFGPPYAHLALSLEAMEALMEADGTLKSSVPAEGFNTLFGNDCADAMFWAYSQISSKVTYTLTRNAICTNGMLPVGGYDVTNTIATADICAANGAEKMYEAYACTRPGDALLFAPGHIRMAAESAYVFRNADGKIDPEKSYILTHEQGAAMGATMEKRHSTCLTNTKYTFAQLFKGNYIPLTIAAFTEGPDAVTVSTTNTATDKTGLAAGIVSSNYRLNWVTVKLTDAAGAAVYSKTVFVTNDNEQDTTQFALSAFRAEINAVKLTTGAQYTYTVEVGVRSEATQVQSFTFTA